MTKIEEIRKRLDAATPGPWREHYEYRDGRPDGTMIGAVAPGHRILTDHDGGTYPSSDLAFIAHAPADIAYLLRVVKELTDLIHEVDGSCGENLAEAMERAEVQR